MKDYIEFIKKDDFSKGLLLGGVIGFTMSMIYDSAKSLSTKIKNKRIQNKLEKEIKG